jgi:hypothetical protein
MTCAGMWTRQAANNGASGGVTATDGNASLEDTFLALVAESAEARDGCSDFPPPRAGEVASKASRWG